MKSVEAQTFALEAILREVAGIQCDDEMCPAGNNNVVQWEGHRFQIPQQARRFSFAGAKVQIYQALNGRASRFTTAIRA